MDKRKICQSFYWAAPITQGSWSRLWWRTFLILPQGCTCRRGGKICAESDGREEMAFMVSGYQTVVSFMHHILEMHSAHLKKAVLDTCTQMWALSCLVGLAPRKMARVVVLHRFSTVTHFLERQSVGTHWKWCFGQKWRHRGGKKSIHHIRQNQITVLSKHTQNSPFKKYGSVTFHQMQSHTMIAPSPIY